MKSKVTKSSKKRKSRSLGLLFISLSITSIVVLGIFYLLKPFNIQENECANSISCINDLSGTYDETEKLATYMGKTIPIPGTLAHAITPDNNRVLGDTTSNKRIYIDLANQKLDAYEGEKLMYSFPVSTGLWGRTPTGDFTIWIKLRYTRMSGGSKELGTYYDLPNVPYTMFFYNSEIPKWRGYGIHGAYWHNNFGHPMSHGCINMREEDVAQIYNWATPVTGDKHTVQATTDNPGTPITIYGVAPDS